MDCQAVSEKSGEPKKVSKLVARQRKVLIFYRTISSTLKTLQEEWRTLLSGLFTELAIHEGLLCRIQHQFRSSKFVQSCKGIRSCHRRISPLQKLDLSSTFSKDLPFHESISKTLQKLSDLGILFSQLKRYSEAAAESITDNLTQEYYYFLGSDVAVLAVVSRIWIIGRKVFEVLENYWNVIVKSLRESGLKQLKNLDVDPHGVFEQQHIRFSESAENVSSKFEKKKRKFLEDGTERPDKRIFIADEKTKKISGALSRFR